jgi:hypothetical protein
MRADHGRASQLHASKDSKAIHEAFISIGRTGKSYAKRLHQPDLCAATTGDPERRMWQQRRQVEQRWL